MPSFYDFFGKNASVCYCGEVNKNILNFIVLVGFLILISVPIYTTSLLDIAQQEKNQLLAQKLLAEKLAAQEAELKKQKALPERIYLLGEFDPAKRDDFAVVPKSLSISGYTMYLRKETLDAFLKMEDAADKDGIDLRVASATRNFTYQKNLWNNKWNALPTGMDGLKKFQKILDFSAAPGTSRHHWGTEIDINNANPQYFNTEEGEEVYNWLAKNAWEFGFCQPYTAKGTDRPTGYNEEKWHWSYVPLSKNFTEDYKNLITNDDIKGFDGEEYVPDLNLINEYVLGINPECL
jgi:LAS superfamily LD-carboxypeptidase LdcB